MNLLNVFPEESRKSREIKTIILDSYGKQYPDAGDFELFNLTQTYFNKLFYGMKTKPPPLPVPGERSPSPKTSPQDFIPPDSPEYRPYSPTYGPLSPTVLKYQAEQEAKGEAVLDDTEIPSTDPIKMLNWEQKVFFEGSDVRRYDSDDDENPPPLDYR